MPNVRQHQKINNLVQILLKLKNKGQEKPKNECEDNFDFCHLHEGPQECSEHPSQPLKGGICEGKDLCKNQIDQNLLK